ncbi:phage tail protein, partial [Streptococcus pyogenes]
LGGDAVAAAKAANMAIMDMADNSAKMGTDITSIQMAYQGFAKQNYTMLDNLRLGYGGTKEEMKRLLSDAEKLPAAMGKKFDLSN